MKKALFIGFGYSARCFAYRLKRRGFHVVGTTRSPEKAARMAADGFHPHIIDPLDREWAGVDRYMAECPYVVVSAAPDEDGDPTLNTGLLERVSHDGGQWVGYLSTVGVYGNHDGAWVDETSPCYPVSERSVRRVAAEEAWLNRASADRRVHVFRLSGIYGPGRSPLARVAKGQSRAIIKPGQVFNRIHVEDIAGALMAAMHFSAKARVFNVTDDEPAPPQEVIYHAADLLGVPRPPGIPFGDAEMTDMARSFYGENKRVRNFRLKDELGVRLRYPTYREGIGALWAAGAAAL